MIESCFTGRDVSSMSSVPGEKEVLFPRNSQFEITGVATTAAEKKKLLAGNTKWCGNVEHLKVYKVKQVA